MTGGLAVGSEGGSRDGPEGSREVSAIVSRPLHQGGHGQGLCHDLYCHPNTTALAPYVGCVLLS